MTINIIILTVLITGFYFMFKHITNDLETRIINLEIKIERYKK